MHHHFRYHIVDAHTLKNNYVPCWILLTNFQNGARSSWRPFLNFTQINYHKNVSLWVVNSNLMVWSLLLVPHIYTWRKLDPKITSFPFSEFSGKTKKINEKRINAYEKVVILPNKMCGWFDNYLIGKVASNFDRLQTCHYVLKPFSFLKYYVRKLGCHILCIIV